jgi:hypothetical protein
MSDPSQNESFQLLGCDDEDVFNAQLKSMDPAAEAGRAERDLSRHVARPHGGEDVRDA